MNTRFKSAATKVALSNSQGRGTVDGCRWDQGPIFDPSIHPGESNITRTFPVTVNCSEARSNVTSSA